MTDAAILAYLDGMTECHGRMVASLVARDHAALAECCRVMVTVASELEAKLVEKPKAKLSLVREGKK